MGKKRRRLFSPKFAVKYAKKYAKLRAALGEVATIVSEVKKEKSSNIVVEEVDKSAKSEQNPKSQSVKNLSRKKSPDLKKKATRKKAQ